MLMLHTHTHPFIGPLSGTTRVSRYQKGKTNLDFTEARDSEWQWHQLGHMQVCISLRTDNHASTTPLKVFYRPDALPAAQPTSSKHWRQLLTMKLQANSVWCKTIYIYLYVSSNSVIVISSNSILLRYCWHCMACYCMCFSKSNLP